MDSKNIIAAISLSSAVIVLYSLFFAPEQSVTEKNLAEKNKIEQNSDTPSLVQKETLVQISRDDALKQNDRIKFENQSIIGSISLKGAAIDDLTFKNYNTTLESNEKVTLLGPRNIENDTSLKVDLFHLIKISKFLIQILFGPSMEIQN